MKGFKRRNRSSWTVPEWREFIEHFATGEDRLAWFITYRQIQQLPVAEPMRLLVLP